MIFLQATTETSYLADLMKTAPTVAVLIGVAWLMYKYVLHKDSIIKDKDALLLQTIADKDEKMDQHQKSLMDLYGKAIEAQNRGNMVQEQLLEVLKDTKEDIIKLSDKIKP